MSQTYFDPSLGNPYLTWNPNLDPILNHGFDPNPNLGPNPNLDPFLKPNPNLGPIPNPYLDPNPNLDFFLEPNPTLTLTLHLRHVSP